MAKRQKQWAARVREALKEKLGRRCAKCGTNQDLEFDCVKPQGHGHHRLDTGRRATFYRRQLAADNLQLLCASCNNEKSQADRRHLEAYLDPRIPLP